jgi:hypothetical protein
VMVTSARGARVSSRRKPLMLFWKVWFDGDGVGDGEAAWVAGAATRRSATTEALTAPNSLSKPRRFPARWPWGVLLKLITSTWGRSRPRHCSRCERSQGWEHAMTPGSHKCEFRHPAWLMLQPNRTGESRGPGHIGSDRITTAAPTAPGSGDRGKQPLLSGGVSSGCGAVRGNQAPAVQPGAPRSRLYCVAPAREL